ncbi:MAG: SPOR domain-containing protein [Sedimentisphaerales bacterium]|nr:SPOR domain-containing protein [Sedimentisphaerales bacterium]
MMIATWARTLCGFVMTLASASSQEATRFSADTLGAYYTVQVLAAPVENEQALQSAYKSLRDEGHLVYYCPARVGERRYLRLRTGLFANRTQAQARARELKKENGFDGFVARAGVFVDSLNRGFDVVTTPSGIWRKIGISATELYHFSSCFNEAPDCPARISPAGTHIAFYHDNKIMTINLSTSRAMILREGTRPDELLHSIVRWSPDGRHIAYLDAVAWELPTRLWVMRSDGTNNRCLVRDETGQTKVKSFLWHPRENRIFYVAGPTHGTVSVGGSLYGTDLAGDRKKIVPAGIEDGEEVFSEFRIADGTLYYKIAHFDEDRQEKQYTLRTLDIGRSAAQLK